MTEGNESECGPISGDELRHMKRLCEVRLAEIPAGYGYTRTFTRRDVALVYRMVLELLGRKGAG